MQEGTDAERLEHHRGIIQAQIREAFPDDVLNRSTHPWRDTWTFNGSFGDRHILIARWILEDPWKDEDLMEIVENLAIAPLRRGDEGVDWVLLWRDDENVPASDEILDEKGAGPPPSTESGGR